MQCPECGDTRYFDTVSGCMVCQAYKDRDDYNAFIDQLQSDVEFPPLLEFLERLKEPVSTSSAVTLDHSDCHVPASEDNDG